MTGGIEVEAEAGVMSGTDKWWAGSKGGGGIEETCGWGEESATR